MKPRFICLACISVSSLLADAPQAKLTIAQEASLADGLAALDGHNVIPKINGQDQPATNISYDFTGDVRWKIRDDLQSLQPKVEAWQKVQQDILKNISGGSGVIAPTDAAKQSAYYQAISEASKVIDTNPPKLTLFSRAELNLNANPIPGTVLNKLAPILP